MLALYVFLCFFLLKRLFPGRSIFGRVKLARKEISQIEGLRIIEIQQRLKHASPSLDKGYFKSLLLFELILCMTFFYFVYFRMGFRNVSGTWYYSVVSCGIVPFLLLGLFRRSNVIRRLFLLNTLVNIYFAFVWLSALMMSQFTYQNTLSSIPLLLNYVSLRMLECWIAIELMRPINRVTFGLPPSLTTIKRLSYVGVFGMLFMTGYFQLAKG